MSEKKILAIVNGKEITDIAVEMFIRNLGQQKGQQFNSEEGRKKVLEELIQQELLYADAIENSYDEDDEFLDRLDKIEEEMLKQYSVFKILDSVKISDEEVNEYYKENKTSFFREATPKASHILVDSEDQANQIIDEINGGLAFEEAARKYSTCPSKQNGGDLGFFLKGRMVKEFEDVAFSMEKEEISKPVKTEFGYHIIKITDKKEPGIIPFDELKDSLKNDLLKAKQNFFYNKKIQELKSIYKIEIKTE